VTWPESEYARKKGNTKPTIMSFNGRNHRNAKALTDLIIQKGINKMIAQAQKEIAKPFNGEADQVQVLREALYKIHECTHQEFFLMETLQECRKKKLQLEEKKKTKEAEFDSLQAATIRNCAGENESLTNYWALNQSPRAAPDETVRTVPSSPAPESEDPPSPADGQEHESSPAPEDYNSSPAPQATQGSNCTTPPGMKGAGATGAEAEGGEGETGAAQVKKEPEPGKSGLGQDALRREFEAQEAAERLTKATLSAAIRRGEEASKGRESGSLRGCAEPTGQSAYRQMQERQGEAARQECMRRRRVADSTWGRGDAAAQGEQQQAGLQAELGAQQGEKRASPAGAQGEGTGSPAGAQGVQQDQAAAGPDSSPKRRKQDRLTELTELEKLTELEIRERQSRSERRLQQAKLQQQQERQRAQQQQGRKAGRREEEDDDRGRKKK
jgi:hypothetical protein